MNEQSIEKSLGCQQPMLRTRAKEGQTLPPISSRWTEEQVVDVISRSYGVRTLVCMQLDCTQVQFANWLLKHPAAKEAMAEARAGLVGMAEETVMKSLNSDDEKTRLAAAQTILKGLGPACGWGVQPAVQIDISAGEKGAQIRSIFGINE